MEKLIENTFLLDAEIDLTSTGTHQRYTIGRGKTATPLADISGALYLSPNVKLPCEVTITFFAGEKESQIAKANAEEVEDEE